MSDKNSPLFSLSNPVHFLALGFGSGLLRPAPGTWGTLVAVPLFLAFDLLDLPLLGQMFCIGIGFVVGIYLCSKTANDVGVADHSAIVWDEIIGFFIAMLAVPVTAVNVVLAFLLFRLFDIVKPWPIRWVDKSVHGGFGIMLDDVLAGIMALAVLQLLLVVL